MDYQKMLFAFHVREATNKALEKQTEGMQLEQVDDFINDHKAVIVDHIVRQVEEYATLIDDAYAMRSAAGAKSFWDGRDPG